MSEAAVAPRALAPQRTRGSVVRLVLGIALLLALLVVPLYVEEYWLRAGFAVFAAAIGAIGLNLLTGTAGQLSLAHAFFLAVGAISYTYISGEPGGLGVTDLAGLDLPPLLGLVVGVLMAGLLGLLFSPIAARLRGIYLGVASLALVFIGEHVLNTWTSVTGGFNGRRAPDFSLFGFTFTNTDPDLYVLGVPFGESERLWYLGLFLTVGAYVVARNLLRSRPGRALQTLRDSEVAASVMGVNVQGYKARVFFVSSMYAGLAGVLYALSIGSIAPESFGLLLSVNFLAMIVLGGLGSVGGAVLGALFITALPLVLQRYAGAIPLVGTTPGQELFVAGEAARYLFGLAIILVILFEPAGLAGIGHRLRGHGRGPQNPGRLTPPPPDTAGPSSASDSSHRSSQGSSQ